MVMERSELTLRSPGATGVYPAGKSFRYQRVSVACMAAACPTLLRDGDVDDR